MSLFESYCMNIEGSVRVGGLGNKLYSKARTGATARAWLEQHDLKCDKLISAMRRDAAECFGLFHSCQAISWFDVLVVLLSYEF